ncbi:MAG: glycoside hydrolase family 88 protein [Erysipelotrichaceae bacterium]|nr:glycoside hydrolase family 88 protein [Erysipelotrichaceae bacterium]
MNNTQINAYVDSYMANFTPYKGGEWCYEDGILMTAIYDMYKVSGVQKYYDFVMNYFDGIIGEDGSILRKRNESYNIDNICPGIALMKLYRDNPLPKFKKCMDYLYDQLMKHPRTKENSFWHKEIYTNQVWMDGIYMGQVFYAMYAKEFGTAGIVEDIDHQLHVADKRLWAPEKNLYMHAYDEAKVMQWADPETGRSPHCWSRACGWVLMAMVDVYEEIGLDICKEILVKEVNSLKPYVTSGMLYQVVEEENKEPNYKETSGSAMMAYALFKAKRIGMLDEYNLGMKVFDTIMAEEFDGTNLNGICRVAGLDNKKRDGSFEYYMSEDISSNEVKGVAPFIMAYSEIYG